AEQARSLAVPFGHSDRGRRHCGCSECHLRPMTALVSTDLRTHRVGEDVTSPELVLVDPDLGALARARLPDVSTAASSPAPRRPPPPALRAAAGVGSPNAVDEGLR